MRTKVLLSFFFIPFLLISLSANTAKAAGISYADSTPAKSSMKDAKAIITDYINAIGGMDAVKKVNSISDTGTLTVQGTSLAVEQKKMAPNKLLQVVTMNGSTVGKTAFNGTKGYAEQMGNHTDMDEAMMADLKMQSSLIEQADYVTNNAYKLSTLDIEKLDGADSYKVLVTMPSGKSDTEYYDVATKLLVKKVVQTTANGQSFTTTNNFSNYKKVDNLVMLPYTLSAEISAGAMTQAFNIDLTDIKLNEGVTDADFD